MNAFIAYLSGRMDWVGSVIGLPTIPTPSALLQRVRSLLELDSVMDVVALYRIINATPNFADKLQTMLGDEFLDGALQQIAPTSVRLTGTVAQTPVTAASSDPSASSLTIAYKSPVEVELISTNYRGTAASTYNPVTHVLTVTWPRSVNLIGAVQLSKDMSWEEGVSVTLPLRQAYPAKRIVSVLDSSDDAYELLTEVDMAGLYYAFGNPVDRLRVMILAIIKKAKHG